MVLGEGENMEAEVDAGVAAERVISAAAAVAAAAKKKGGVVNGERAGKELRREMEGRTKAEHLARLRARGGTYLSASLSKQVEGPDRIEALRAAVDFLLTESKGIDEFHSGFSPSFQDHRLPPTHDSSKCANSLAKTKTIYMCIYTRYSPSKATSGQYSQATVSSVSLHSNKEGGYFASSVAALLDNDFPVREWCMNTAKAMQTVLCIGEQRRAGMR